MKALLRSACLSLALVPLLHSAEALPRDWIDPETGHRIIRLSPDTGGTSLYFHQRSYTPEGDKIVIRAEGGIATVDLSTLGVSPPKVELVLAGTSPIATAWRTREAYYVDRPRGVLMAVHLDTKAVREVAKLPAPAGGGQFALNCDETLLVGIGPCQLHLLVASNAGQFVHAHAGLRRVIRGALPAEWPVIAHWRLTTQI